MKQYEEMTEQEVRAVAKIIGPHSAAAQALADAERRKSQGEVVRFFHVKNMILVVGDRPVETGPEDL